MRLPANHGERQGRKAYGTDEKPEATEKFANGLADEFRAFWADEDGVGVIEVVLILVVLIGLVIIFKTQIRKLLETIFKQIETQSKEVY